MTSFIHPYIHNIRCNGPKSPIFLSSFLFLSLLFRLSIYSPCLFLSLNRPLLILRLRTSSCLVSLLLSFILMVLRTFLAHLRSDFLFFSRLCHPFPNSSHVQFHLRSHISIDSFVLFFSSFFVFVVSSFPSSFIFIFLDSSWRPAPFRLVACMPVPLSVCLIVWSSWFILSITFIYIHSRSESDSSFIRLFVPLDFDFDFDFTVHFFLSLKLPLCPLSSSVRFWPTYVSTYAQPSRPFLLFIRPFPCLVFRSNHLPVAYFLGLCFFVILNFVRLHILILIFHLRGGWLPMAFFVLSWLSACLRVCVSAWLRI